MRGWILFAIPLGLLLSFGGTGPGRGARAKLTPAAQGSQVVTDVVNANLGRHWQQANLATSDPVDDLAFARRLWLDLLGTIPSLEEIREIEAMPEEGRRAKLIDRVLGDDRFAPKLAERLARIAVGADAPVDDLTYRRRRLVDWLSQQIEQHRPYDELAYELIASQGISTDTPAVNFVLSQEKDPIKLAARATRSFLGIRIDCAQCHNHPFTDWKQQEFEGLAAFFAEVTTNVGGVQDEPGKELWIDRPLVEDPGDLVGGAMPGGMAADVPKRKIAAAVPFNPELLPENTPRRREAFAAWATHANNPYFAKAIVNRLWGWLMGRGFVEPLDELDSTVPWNKDLLDHLAADLIANDFDLERTIRAIVSSEAYTLSSRAVPDQDEDEALDLCATYRLKPLHAEQLAAATFQATTLWTNNRSRNQLIRMANFFGRSEYVNRHAVDPGSEVPPPETLLQRLHIMNGEKFAERVKADDIFGVSSRIPLLATDDESAIEIAFLMTLTRRPTAAERTRLSQRLAEAGQGDERSKFMADLVWALVNSTEFSWNH